MGAPSMSALRPRAKRGFCRVAGLLLSGASIAAICSPAHASDQQGTVPQAQERRVTIDAPAPVAGDTSARHDRRLTGPVTGGRLAVAYGVAALVMGAAQAVRPPEDTVAAIDTPMRWLLALFAVSLLLVSPAHLALARFARGPWGGRLAAVGTPLLAVGAMSSAVNGEDLAFFPAVAMVANALWLIGVIALAVSLGRAKRVSLWIVLPLPFLQLGLLFFSQIGGAVPAGLFLVAVGAVFLAGRIASRARRRAQRIVR